MGLHLLIIGDPREPDTVLNAVHDKVWARPPSFLVDRCASPAKLFETVRRNVVKQNMLVDVLDVYDHGAGGTVKLGNQHLFDEDDERVSYRGRHIAKSLAPMLLPGARIRLLGCNVAKSEAGRELLLDIEGMFNDLGVIIQGTIERTLPDYFNEDGFLPHLEETYLFSSIEARQGLAPSYRERFVEISERLDRLRRPDDP